MTSWQNRITETGEADPEELLANPFNFRVHPKHQQDSLSAVLDSVGFVSRVLVNRTTGHVVDGHLRVSLALSRNEKSIPVDYVELSENEEKQVLATFDAITNMATIDKDVMKALYEGMNADTADMQELLTELAEAQGIILDDTPIIDPEPQINLADELQKKWQTERGQVWVIPSKSGNFSHRVMCGDSTNADDVAKLMDGKRADCMINDAPYGMRLDTDYSSAKASDRMRIGKGVTGGLKWDAVIGDDQDFDATPIVKQFSYIKEQFWFGADYYSVSLPDTMHSGSWLVWDKRLEESADKMYGSCFELIWSAQRHKRDILRHKWAGIFGTERELEKKRLHPTMKPTSLIADIITRYTNDSDIVLDCFIGSGATIVACEQTGRVGFGMEISEAYTAVVLQRLADMGLTPTLDGKL